MIFDFNEFLQLFCSLCTTQYTLSNFTSDNYFRSKKVLLWQWNSDRSDRQAAQKTAAGFFPCGLIFMIVTCITFKTLPS